MNKTLLSHKKIYSLLIFLFFLFSCSLSYAQSTPTCSGTWGPPIVNQTFGQGNNTDNWYGPLSSYAPGATTSTIFVGAAGPNGNLNDGYSGLVKSPSVGGFGFINSADHTGNPNGLMLLINAPSTDATIFFEYTMNNLCPNTFLKLSVWILNVNNSGTPSGCGASYQYPNITLRAIDPVTNAILGTTATGNVPVNSTWTQYSITFNNGSSSSAKLQFINNSVGSGCGNDLAIDDITVQPCIPATIQAQPGASTTLCPNKNTTVDFTATLTGSSYNPAEYQWQYSSDGGTTWVDQGTPTTNPNYTFNSNGKAPGNHLIRFKVGPQGSVLNSQCNAVSQTATVTIGSLPVVTEATIRSCYIQTNPSTATFNLTTANVTTEQGTTKRYFPSQTDAFNGTNEIPNPIAYTAPNGAAYIRVTNNNGCFSIAKVTLQVIPPTTSSVLVDKIICIEGRTSLDAGPGFNAYTWSTGATTQQINNVTTGTYWVDLRSGDCTTRQTVKVYPSPNPVIQSVDITNNTATINVTGGTPPYQYAMDKTGNNWQDSNIFKNLTRGQHTFYVKDTYNCTPVPVEVTIPNLINVITPNGDSKNDVIDYSALAYKNNLLFEVYDRYGKKVYEAGKIRNFTWDGTSSGKKLPTATYWYTISWTENNKKNTPIRYNGWVLVKNRE
ncbi:T9SS type B sorting domain-containing protein [Chryseobacterium sp. PMSZPI]|uniref:T9SS type B sorting domain-containing protein n=1 Tax=Chryseobacterium sp. PMSZPI TaxID=1033900 RepID=UPI000C33B5A3|nr:T9SS type B sorting domain-containing protein [Chryseobacterium sp. PMSZPI]PKF75673.1 hypothetical protein CW752_02885 [Chryseobacterium sp. PMSZPI]